MPIIHFDMNGWVIDPVLVSQFISRIDGIEMMIEASPGVDMRKVHGIRSLGDIRERAAESEMYHENSLALVCGVEAALSGKDTIDELFNNYKEEQINLIKGDYNG